MSRPAAPKASLPLSAVLVAAVSLGAYALGAPRSEAPTNPAPAVAVAPEASPSQTAATLAPPPAHEPVTPDEACRRLGATPFPAADVPTPEERKALAGCDAEALYYGIGRPVDFDAARKCAYVQRDDATKAPVMGGNAILLMIYANGKGVATSFDLAARFACEGGHAQAERSARLERILTARTSGALGLAPSLEFCDDMTSSFLMGWCRLHEERIAKAERDARMRGVTKGMPAAAVERLDKTAEAFFEARALKEVDMNGTMRGVFSIGERARLRAVHVSMLEKLADPRFSPPPVDAERFEQGLQKAYDAVVKCKKNVPADSLSVGAKGILETELAWLAYRNAWLSLVTQARGAAHLDAWKAWITEQRTKMLKDLTEWCV